MEKIPDPKDIEKDISEFLTKKYGGAVRMITPVVLPHTSVWHRLGHASHSERLGETVALVLSVLGDGGPAQADPLILEKVIGALNRIGLEHDARALAVEAALAAGL